MKYSVEVDQGATVRRIFRPMAPSKQWRPSPSTEYLIKCKASVGSDRYQFKVPHSTRHHHVTAAAASVITIIIIIGRNSSGKGLS